MLHELVIVALSDGLKADKFDGKIQLPSLSRPIDSISHRGSKDIFSGHRSSSPNAGGDPRGTHACPVLIHTGCHVHPMNGIAPHPIINSKLAFTSRLVAAVSTLMESLVQHCVEFVPLLQVLHPRLTRPRSPFPTTLDRCESNRCPTFNNETVELPILDEYLFVSPEKLIKQQIRGHFLDRNERHEVFHGRCNHPTRSIRDQLDHLYLPHETIVFKHLLSTATSDIFIQRRNGESTRRLMRHSTSLIFDHRPQSNHCTEASKRNRQNGR